MLQKACKHPIAFDEDLPELTSEMKKAFRLATNYRVPHIRSKNLNMRYSDPFT